MSPSGSADVTGTPLAFTYLFSGALAGSPHAYLQLLLPGSLALDTLAVLSSTFHSGVTLTRDLATSVF